MSPIEITAIAVVSSLVVCYVTIATIQAMQFRKLLSSWASLEDQIEAIRFNADGEDCHFDSLDDEEYLILLDRRNQIILKMKEMPFRSIGPDGIYSPQLRALYNLDPETRLNEMYV